MNMLPCREKSTLELVYLANNSLAISPAVKEAKRGPADSPCSFTPIAVVNLSPHESKILHLVPYFLILLTLAQQPPHTYH